MIHLDDHTTQLCKIGVYICKHCKYNRVNKIILLNLVWTCCLLFVAFWYSKPQFVTLVILITQAHSLVILALLGSRIWIPSLDNHCKEFEFHLNYEYMRQLISNYINHHRPDWKNAVYYSNPVYSIYYWTWKFLLPCLECFVRYSEFIYMQDSNE